MFVNKPRGDWFRLHQALLRPPGQPRRFNPVLRSGDGGCFWPNEPEYEAHFSFVCVWYAEVQPLQQPSG